MRRTNTPEEFQKKIPFFCLSMAVSVLVSMTSYHARYTVPTDVMNDFHHFQSSHAIDGCECTFLVDINDKLSRTVGTSSRIPALFRHLKRYRPTS